MSPCAGAGPTRVAPDFTVDAILQGPVVARGFVEDGALGGVGGREDSGSVTAAMLRVAGAAVPRPRPATPYGEKETVSGISEIPMARRLPLSLIDRDDAPPEDLRREAPHVEVRAGAADDADEQPPCNRCRGVRDGADEALESARTRGAACRPRNECRPPGRVTQAAVDTPCTPGDSTPPPAPGKLRNLDLFASYPNCARGTDSRTLDASANRPHGRR